MVCNRTKYESQTLQIPFQYPLYFFHSIGSLSNSNDRIRANSNSKVWALLNILKSSENFNQKTIFLFVYWFLFFMLRRLMIQWTTPLNTYHQPLIANIHQSENHFNSLVTEVRFGFKRFSCILRCSMFYEQTLANSMSFVQSVFIFFKSRYFEADATYGKSFLQSSSTYPTRSRCRSGDYKKFFYVTRILVCQFRNSVVGQSFG